MYLFTCVYTCSNVYYSRYHGLVRDLQVRLSAHSHSFSLKGTKQNTIGVRAVFYHMINNYHLT